MPPTCAVVSRGVLEVREKLLEHVAKSAGLRFYIVNFEPKRRPDSEYITNVDFGGTVRSTDWIFRKGGPAVHVDPRIWGLLDTVAPRCVIASGFGSLTTLLALAWSKSRRVPFILWNENTLLTDGLRHPLIWSAKRWIARRADSCWATTPETMAILREMKAPSSCLVPYAVDADCFHAEAERWRPRRAEVRAELGLTADLPLAIQVGQINSRKGIVEILMAFRQVVSKLDAGLLLVGSGPLEDYLRAKITAYGLGSFVRHVRHVPNELLPKYYSAADVFVMPSQGDIWGLVVNEAAACGLPLVLSDRVGAAQLLLKDGVNGYLVRIDIDEALGYRGAQKEARIVAGHDPKPCFDPARFVGPLTALLGNRSLTRRMGEASVPLGLALGFRQVGGIIRDSLARIGLLTC